MPQELTTVAYDFFFWFSRFEFALKENHFLKSSVVGAKAQPGWDKFVQSYQSEYALTATAAHLIDAAPEQQVVGAGGFPLLLTDAKPDLQIAEKYQQALQSLPG